MSKLFNQQIYIRKLSYVIFVTRCGQYAFAMKFKFEIQI